MNWFILNNFIHTWKKQWVNSEKKKMNVLHFSHVGYILKWKWLSKSKYTVRYSHRLLYSLLSYHALWADQKDVQHYRSIHSLVSKTFIRFDVLHMSIPIRLNGRHFFLFFFFHFSFHISMGIIFYRAHIQIATNINTRYYR